MNWIIYYGDGSTFSSNDGTWLRAPVDNIQVIVQTNPEGGLMTCAGSDYYFMTMRDGDEHPRWYGGDIIGLLEYLRTTGRVKFGLHISNGQYKKILERAKKDGLP